MSLPPYFLLRVLSTSCFLIPILDRIYFCPLYFLSVPPIVFSLWALFTYFSRSPFWVNLLPQTEHPCRFSSVWVSNHGWSPLLMETFTKTSVWVRNCFSQVLLVLKTFPTVTKAKGDSPLCVRICAVKVLFWWKLFPLSPQLNGFLPVWIRLCAFRFLLRLKLFPQSPQPNKFSPVWFIICLDRFPLGLKVLRQMGQGYDFPRVTCLSRSTFGANVLPKPQQR